MTQVNHPISVAGLEVKPTQLDAYFDFQSPDDIRLKGTRVGIENILYRYIYKAETPEEILPHFYTITLEQVYATILYYLHNQESVRKYMSDWLKHCHQAQADQQRKPSPVVQKLIKLMAEQEGKPTQKAGSDDVSISHG